MSRRVTIIDDLGHEMEGTLRPTSPSGIGESATIIDDQGFEVDGIIEKTGGAPVGEGIWVWLALLLLVVITAGFYLMIKLTLNGYREAKRGNWSKAMLFWATPGFLAIYIGFQWLDDVAEAQARNQRRENYEQQIQAEITQLDQYFPLELKDINRVRCTDIDHCWRHREWEIYVVFTATNQWSDGQVWFDLEDGSGLDCGQMRLDELGSQQFACKEDDLQITSEVCIDAWLRPRQGNLLYQSLPDKKLCRDVKDTIRSNTQLVDEGVDMQLFFAEPSCDTGPCPGKEVVHARITMGEGIHSYVHTKFIVKEDDHQPSLSSTGEYAWFGTLRPHIDIVLYAYLLDKDDIGKTLCVDLYTERGLDQALKCAVIPSS